VNKGWNLRGYALLPLLGLALMLAGCGSGARTRSGGDFEGRVRLQSNQVLYRDLAEALLFAQAQDTLTLEPGTFRGAFEVRAKDVRVQGPRGEKPAVLLLDAPGIRVSEGGRLALDTLTLACPAVGLGIPAIRAEGAGLELRDVRAQDVPGPLVRFESPDGLLTVLRTHVSGATGTLFELAAGSAYLSGSTFLRNAGPVLALGDGARRVHLAHSTLLKNGTLLALTPACPARLRFAFSVLDDPRAGASADDNLVLTAGEALKLFPRLGRGDASPEAMPRQDPDGVDFGARPAAEGIKHLREYARRWLGLFNDYSALRAHGFLPPGAEHDSLLEQVRQNLYRRLASFLTGRRPGLLTRDAALATPFVPDEWHLRDRLRGARRELVRGVPGELRLVGVEAVPGLRERLEGFFAAHYAGRDPNEVWRVDLEVIKPLGTTNSSEALSRQETFASPEHASAEQNRQVLGNKLSLTRQRLAKASGELGGARQKRALDGRGYPDSQEQRLAARVAELEAEVRDLEKRLGEAEASLKRFTPEITCVFKGQKRVTVESMELKVNGELLLTPRREVTTLTLEPAPACGFAGYQRSFTRPAAESWLVDAVSQSILARYWVEGRVEALQRGLVQPELARADSDQADELYRLLFQDLALVRTARAPEAGDQAAPVEEWLAISRDAAGRPVFNVPFNPPQLDTASPAFQLLPQAGLALEAWFEAHFLEPLFLFEDALR